MHIIVGKTISGLNAPLTKITKYKQVQTVHWEKHLRQTGRE